MTGKAPLLVHFDGSGSADADGDTIASYTFNFGDGSAPVTQSTPTIQHTYNAAGDYPARLTVTDSRGHSSTNTAQVVISVASASIQPVSVVSRKTHGTITPSFDINLPLTGTRGVECRSGGANGNYTMVFQFANALTSVGGASVTTGTGSVSSSAIGMNTHEYIVNLTGVTNAQYLAVTLTNVQDSAGNSGNVTSPQMGVLLGDTTANGLVNSSDIAQTQSQSGQPVTSNNFREDVTVNGLINSSDISLVQSMSGTGLPSSP
jgi:hypothetical protein